MMEIAAYAAFVYMGFQLLVALVNLISAQYLKRAVPQGNPLISVLIPARDEESNIGNLLNDLMLLDYGNFEVLVYDDESSDRTEEIIREKSARDNRISYTRGNELLPGWLGKNYACHNLARQARGEYLLFIDADVRVTPGMLNDTLSTVKSYNLDLLSLFPVQQMRSPGEWLTVPLMNRILLGNLPLILVRVSRMPDFAAANGQFMLFKAETYKKQWFHKSVNNEKVEDIRIMRLLKTLKFRGHTLLSAGQVSCRMYKGYGEALNGFSKNIHAFFGRNWFLLFLFVFLTTLGPFAVWAALPFPAVIIYLTGIVIFKITVSVQSRQSWWLNVLLMPLQQLSLVIISFLAAYRQAAGKLSWKGREI